MQDLIVFSHLRWNFVHQRPQHLMSRLARWWRVLFVEEPVQRDGEPGWERQTPCEGVVTLRPHTPLPAHGFDEAQMPLLREMLARMLERESVESPVAWFYTPMALPLLAGLRPRAIVYDCMDELSAFRHAPAGLKEREAELLGIADVVFTGGPSLHAAKRGRHPNVHCSRKPRPRASAGWRSRAGMSPPPRGIAWPSGWSGWSRRRSPRAGPRRSPGSAGRPASPNGTRRRPACARWTT